MLHRSTNIPLHSGHAWFSTALAPLCLALFLLLLTIYDAPRCEALRVGFRVSTCAQGFVDINELVNAAENDFTGRGGASRVTDLEVDSFYAKDNTTKMTVRVVAKTITQAPSSLAENRLFLITLPSTGNEELFERSSADAILSSLTSLHFGHLTKHAIEDEGKEPAMQRRDYILYSTSHLTLVNYALMRWIGFHEEIEHLEVNSNHWPSENAPIFVAPRAQVCLRLRIELQRYVTNIFALNNLARLAGAEGLLHGVDFHCSPPTAEEAPPDYLGDDGGWTPTCVRNYAFVQGLIQELYLFAGAVFVSFSGLGIEKQLAKKDGGGLPAGLQGIADANADGRMATLLNIRRPKEEDGGSVGKVEKMINALRERRPTFDYAAILVGNTEKKAFRVQPLHPMLDGTWTMMEMIASQASLLQGRIIVSTSDITAKKSFSTTTTTTFSSSTVQHQGNESCWKLSDSDWESLFANLWLKPGDRLAKLLFNKKAQRISKDPDLGEERRVLNFMNEHIIKPMVAHAIRYMGRHCQLPQQFRSSSGGNHQESEGSEQLVEKLDRSFLIPGTEGFQLLQRVKVHTEFAAEQILGKIALPEDDCAWLSGELSAISAETVAYLVRKAEPLLRNSGFILEGGVKAKNKPNFLLFQLALTMVGVNIELATRALIHHHYHNGVLKDTAPPGVVALRDSIDDPVGSPFAMQTVNLT